MPIEILMPALSPTMTKTGGKIAKWHKKVNDKVNVGDVIAEIETDKAIMEFESIDEGTIAEILVQEGIGGIPINQPIALMLEEGENASSIDNYTISSSSEKPVEKESKISIESSDKKILSHSSVDRIKASPLAKKIAQNEEVSLSTLKGTGPYGRILKVDVLEALSNRSQCNETHNRIRSDSIIEVSSMRHIIAQRLVESKQNIPHFYLTINCQVDKLISLKNEVNSANTSIKVTINDLIIKAVALSMQKFPDINVSWIDDKIVKYSNVDISVAVAVDDGLITPIIKNADKKSILSISRDVKDLVSRAKVGKLKPEEFQGGGFTISNLGMFGIKSFSAIINPPQSCIMAVGASERQPIVANEKIEIAEIMSITLSVDHRTVDGAQGARFLNAFKTYIENPLSMLLST